MPIPRFTAQPFFDPRDESLRFLPEGPRVLRHQPRPSLGWVAIQHGADATVGSLNVLDLATRTNVNHSLPGRPGFFAETTRPGVLLVGLERRLVLYDLATRRLEETGAAIPEHPRVIINDGLAVEGGVIFGAKHLEFNQPIAGLDFYDARRREVVELRAGQTCSNGKMLTGATLIDIDSSPRTITRYELAPDLRAVLSHSLIVPPAALPAFPDGLRPTPDGRGFVVAFYNPQAVPDGLAWQLDATTGDVLGEWILPGSPRVTCPEFVEWEGSVKLIFTTALEGMADDIRRQAPGAGQLYMAETPFSSLPPAPPLVDM
ncbi:MAG: SMP-30/gluconolactonase/LRE family protein [Bryobacterales bacterium]|nr:SMP-30/gluconolactonase/LRE family protein [Bryobacterales bacterium]